MATYNVKTPFVPAIGQARMEYRKQGLNPELLIMHTDDFYEAMNEVGFHLCLWENMTYIDMKVIHARDHIKRGEIRIYSM